MYSMFTFVEPLFRRTEFFRKIGGFEKRRVENFLQMFLPKEQKISPN